MFIVTWYIFITKIGVDTCLIDEKGAQIRRFLGGWG